MLDIWATWYGPCKAAMPSTQKVHEEYADQPVTVFGPTPQWMAAAAAGLCALMIAALIVRLRIEDPWYAMLPAFVLLIVNGWIAVKAWQTSVGS